MVNYDETYSKTDKIFSVTFFEKETAYYGLNWPDVTLFWYFFGFYGHVEL